MLDRHVSSETIDKTCELASKVGQVLVATCSADGVPHIAAAGRLAAAGGEMLQVTEWFCPGTVANLRDNSRVALVVWDAASDEGLQLVGEVVEIEDLAVLDGYDPATEPSPAIPQVSRQLLVRIDKAMQFSRRPHSDTEV